MSDRYRHILITGASSGLGAALAAEYAGPDRMLTLGGRNAERLGAVAAACRKQGADVHAEAVDVEDKDAVRDWIERADARTPLDLVIANAGISAGTGGGGESETQARDIFATNMAGVLNTLHPALDLMRIRRKGQLAIVSSIAGYRGMPGAPAYSASKAAALAYGEALRGDLKREGIGVSVICPGFVKTPMTDLNPFPMPFLMPAEKAARIIRRGLIRNRALITFPWPMRLAAWWMRVLPSGVVTYLLSGLPEKSAGKE